MITEKTEMMEKLVIQMGPTSGVAGVLGEIVGRMPFGVNQIESRKAGYPTFKVTIKVEKV